jgi:hypothetical protein
MTIDVAIPEALYIEDIRIHRVPVTVGSNQYVNWNRYLPSILLILQLRSDDSNQRVEYVYNFSSF